MIIATRFVLVSARFCGDVGFVAGLCTDFVVVVDFGIGFLIVVFVVGLIECVGVVTLVVVVGMLVSDDVFGVVVILLDGNV